MRKSSTEDLNLLDKVTRPTVIVGLVSRKLTIGATPGSTGMITRTVAANSEQRRIWIFAIFSFRQVSPDSVPSRFSQVDNPSFSTFRAAFSTVADLELAPRYK